MKNRLDVELVNRYLAESRERARSYIMSGIVYVDGQKALKPGETVKAGSLIEIRGNTLKYVSRGGLKLEKAISSFNIVLKNKVCVDVGASTGGFTDCMLQNGAKKVYAIDVGYGQLAWKLRQDERVVNLERTNIRHLDLNHLTEPIEFSSVDTSFISLKLVLPKVYEFLSKGGYVAALIKPQFEAQRSDVGKKGVIKDAQIHKKVIEKCIKDASNIGFSVKGLDFSPIKGPQGNIEFLMYLKKEEESVFFEQEEVVDQLINKAHDFLD